jgi:hypothetical protein
VDAVGQGGIHDLHSGFDDAVLADDGIALEIDVGIDDGVTADGDAGLDVSGVGVDQGNPLVQVAVVDAGLHHLGGLGQLSPAVDAQEVLPIRVEEGFHPLSPLPGDMDEVG